MTEVLIYVDRDPMPWGPRDTEAEGLPGGTETAVVEVGGGLAELGYQVRVHGNVHRAETHAGVTYGPREALDADRPVDALIACRAPELLDAGLPARTTMLWEHRPDLGKSLTAARAQRVDRVLALSEWHARRLRSRHPAVADRVITVRNGVDSTRFSGPGRRAARVVSSAQPERGLDVLLELWPEVRAAVPDAELAYCYAPVYEFVATRNPDVARHRRRVERLSRQPGVRALGPLRPEGHERLMRDSRVWAHPSWSTLAGEPFEEASCIAAMEAQAAGLWVVASGWGALSETVRVGSVIQEGAPGEPWRSRFVEEIVRGLTDAETQRRAEADGPSAMSEMGWGRVAARIARVIENGAR